MRVFRGPRAPGASAMLVQRHSSVVRSHLSKTVTSSRSISTLARLHSTCRIRLCKIVRHVGSRGPPNTPAVRCGVTLRPWAEHAKAQWFTRAEKPKGTDTRRSDVVSELSFEAASDLCQAGPDALSRDREAWRADPPGQGGPYLTIA